MANLGGNGEAREPGNDVTPEMARSSPRSVAITGAGSGIGAELARCYAAPGRTLFLAGRNAGRLREVAETCRGLGATAEVTPVDVRDGSAVGAWVEAIEAAGPLDLMIVNAGIFGGRPDQASFEPGRQAADIIATNLTGAIHCAAAVAPRMAERGRGHIALISSLAAHLPAADAPGYSASKAGLTAYGEALREDLAAHGVRVTLIHPGHVETAQTRVHVGPLPLMITPGAAARRIFRALEAGRSGLSFPRLAWAWVRLCTVLPWRLRARLNRPARFTVRRGDGPGDGAGR